MSEEESATDKVGTFSFHLDHLSGEDREDLDPTAERLEETLKEAGYRVERKERTGIHRPMGTYLLVREPEEGDRDG